MPMRNIQIFNYGASERAWKHDIYYAGTLLVQIDEPRNGVPVRSGLLSFRLTLTTVYNSAAEKHSYDDCDYTHDDLINIYKPGCSYE